VLKSSLWLQSPFDDTQDIRFASFRGISPLGSAFMSLRWFMFAHVFFQVRSLCKMTKSKQSSYFSLGKWLGFQRLVYDAVEPGAHLGLGDRGDIKTYESNFIHHDFVQFGQQNSRYKAIFPSIVLSQQCCDCKVYFIPLIVVNPCLMRLDYQILLKSLP